MADNLKIIYRISDGAQKTVDKNGQNIIKNKPDYITKRNCLLNFIKILYLLYYHQLVDILLLVRSMQNNH